MEKRIAFISEHASPLATPGGTDAGGQNVYVTELAKELARLQYQVDIFTRWENEQLPQVVCCSPGIRVVHIEAGPRRYIEKENLLPYMADFRRHLIDFIRNTGQNYELIHAHFFMSALVAMEVKMIMGIPFVVTFHALGHIRRLFQGSNDRFPAERIQIETDAIRFADRVIAECPQDKEDLTRFYSAPERKISVIPCGVNTAQFYRIPQQEARAHINIPKEDFTLLQLGRMVPRKGIENVIRSLDILCKKDLPFRLIIVGGDPQDVAGQPELARLQDLCKLLGIADRVSFAGKKEQQELKYYYSAADIFITTPWYEPFGITPLEAMACQTPVIGSGVGGITYSVKEGATGLLVAPEDPVALADSILYLSKRPEYLRQLGRNGLSRVQTLFTWQGIAGKMAAVYEEIRSVADFGIKQVV
ncbi:glycosyl transferase family 1 [Niabella ginsenosidivorans]|uniref:Glycosyl transferase family 1 n=1 Tax=Niabella ginsenosidivorans TaxID=1176587 RepID=A0A1A9I5C8_9BACT|nr:glycosyltransferase [Niabella ginsenosidivorans]ANH81890.1 glycosyl transferase family 1 [Niabella ginsenosidivorans]